MEAADITRAINMNAADFQDESGEIDWERVATGYLQREQLQINAGTSTAELEEALSTGVNPGAKVPFYRDAIEAGYVLPQVNNTGIENSNTNTVQVAFLAHIKGVPGVGTEVTLIRVDVLSSSDGGATVDIESRISDNFFSSGATVPGELDLGRTEDRDFTDVTRFVFAVVEGVIYVSDLTPL